MKSTLTIRLDRDLERQLDRQCKRTGQKRSDIVRDALRRELSLRRFEEIRRRALPFAEARGYLTDEDVMRDVS
jgi:predicted transcriptional regulator